jgi:hypothetical protein
MPDGRLFLAVGYAWGGAPYGVFADEMPVTTVCVRTPESDQLPEA